MFLNIYTKRPGTKNKDNNKHWKIILENKINIYKRNQK